MTVLNSKDFKNYPQSVPVSRNTFMGDVTAVSQKSPDLWTEVLRLTWIDCNYFPPVSGMNVDCWNGVVWVRPTRCQKGASKQSFKKILQLILSYPILFHPIRLYTQTKWWVVENNWLTLPATCLSPGAAISKWKFIAAHSFFNWQVSHSSSGPFLASRVKTP